MKRQPMLKVRVNDRQNLVAVPRRQLTQLLRLVAPAEWQDAELSVTIVDGETMRSLNRQYRGRQYVADVLAFPLEDSADRVVGEIVACAEVAKIEAAERNVPVEDELALYVLHGALHLLGYDDHRAMGRRRMYAREAEAMQRAGLQYVRKSVTGD